MSSNREIAEQTVANFKAWVATQSDDEFKQIVRGGKIERNEIVKAIGCSRSALLQNPTLKKYLKELEDQLRSRGILPPLSAKAKVENEEPKEFDNTINKRKNESKRLSILEQENIELKAKVKELENKLEKYDELSNILYQTGFMPR